MKFANSRYLWIPVRDYLVSSFFIYIYIYSFLIKREGAISVISKNYFRFI